MRFATRPDSRSKRPKGRLRMLSREQERELIKAWQGAGDRRALSRLCRSFEPLIRRIAGRFRRYRLPLEDMVQEGQIGLIEAAGAFDTTRNVRFATYAVWPIRARIQDFVLRNSSIVRTVTTRERKSLFFKLPYVQAAMSSQRGTDTDVNGRAARQLAMPLHEVERMDQTLRKGDLALNARLPNSAEELETLLADDRPGPESVAIERDSRAYGVRCLETAIEALDERERLIVRRRRLVDGNAATLKALGRELGISTERVRQIEHAAIAKMGDIIRAVADSPADLLTDAVPAST